MLLQYSLTFDTVGVESALIFRLFLNWNIWEMFPKVHGNIFFVISDVLLIK